MTQTDDPRQQLLQCVSLLAIARQATDFGEEAQLVYVELLKAWPVDWILLACQWFAVQPKAEYTSAMPSVGDLIAQARKCRRQQQDAEEARRREEQPRLGGYVRPSQPWTAARYMALVEQEWVALRRARGQSADLVQFKRLRRTRQIPLPAFDGKTAALGEDQ